MLEPDLTSDSDEDLLVYVGLDGEEGSSAWAEFYRRHVRYVFETLKLRWGSVLNQSDLEDVVQDTFIRARDRSGSYDLLKSSQDNPDPVVRSRRAVRVWLGTIAQNVLRDQLSARRRWVPEGSTDLADVAAETRESSPPSRELKAVTQALSELPEREQDVIRMTMLFHKPGEAHQRLPNDASLALAARWNTTNTNVRAIRSRAMKTLTERANELLRREDR